MRHLNKLFVFVVLLSMVLSACGGAPAATEQPAEQPAQPEQPAATEVPAQPEQPAMEEKFIFGMLLVGPYNDRGYSQAHYEGGLYVQEKLAGSEMIYVDKVNPADRPGTTPAQLAEDLISKGAKVIIFNSDDMKDSAIEFAQAHPEIITIHASGDSAWAEGKDYKSLPNMGNVFGRMEYGKMMAGCAAALQSKTGQIGYLGPLINDETRRLASSAYLGAKYCWTNYLGKDAADLKFKVTWIGFWFNIPGVTSDPTQVADDFFNSGYDVVISGIDTTEAVTEAKKFAAEGKEVWAIPYDYVGSCEEGQEVCIGVPYFNWGPSYLAPITAAKDGTWQPGWAWNGPDWNNINDPDTSHVGFVEGAAITPEASATLEKFIMELAGGLTLWQGPLNLQDKTAYLAEGEVATDFQVWYLPLLLEGMEGASQ
jgi:simple sugar transport system substrate-binding protein